MASPPGCICIVLIASLISGIRGHGRLLEPPSRASMWRVINENRDLIAQRDCIKQDYNDNQLFCGGKSWQHERNSGKCGVCGDPYDASPREHEQGGRFATGIVTRQYEVNQLMLVVVEITAAHMGYFEFRLCPWNNTQRPVTQDCLDKYLLEFSNGETKHYLPDENPIRKYNLYVRLPKDVTCSQCFLQWRYRTGNSWGCDDDGTCAVGRGDQEEFYGCADIAIGTSDRQPTTCKNGGSPSVAPSSTSTTTSRPSTTTSSTTSLPPSSSSPNESNSCRSKSSEGQIFCMSCTDYHQCVNGKAMKFKCPVGTVCSNNNDGILCDFPYKVDGCQ